MAGRAAELALRVSEEGADAAAAGLDKVGSSARAMGDKVESAGKSAEKGAAGLDKTAEGADEVASKGAQAAGAMAGLGDLIGGPFGAAMQTGGIGLQAMADSGDLLNAALENSVVASLRAKAATVAKTVADKASAVATRTMTLAQKALNVAQRASPLGLIITGVLLLVGAVTLAYKRSDTFRRVVDKAMGVARAGVQKVIAIWKALGPVVGKVASFIGNVVKTYVGVYVKAFQLSLGVVKAVWSAIRDAVGNATDAVRGKADAIRDKFVSSWNAIRDKGGAAFRALTAPVQAIIDLVQGLLDKIKSIHLPHLPGFLSRVTGAGMGPPLPRTGGTGDTVNATTNTFTINLQGTATASQAQELMQAIDDRLRSLGRAPVFS